MGAGCVRACMDWRVVGQSRRYLFYPHGRCRWCSQQRRDLGGIAFLFELVDIWPDTLGLLLLLLLSIRSRCEGLVPCSRGQ